MRRIFRRLAAVPAALLLAFALGACASAATVTAPVAGTPAFTVTNNDTGEKSAADPAAASAETPLVMTTDGTSFSLEVPDGWAYNISNPDAAFAVPVSVATGPAYAAVSGAAVSSIDFNTGTGEFAISATQPFTVALTPDADTAGLDDGLFCTYSVTAGPGASPLLITPKTGGIVLSGADLSGVTVDGTDATGAPVTSYLCPGGTVAALAADASAPALTETDSAALDANSVSAASGSSYDYDDEFMDEEDEEASSSYSDEDDEDPELYEENGEGYSESYGETSEGGFFGSVASSMASVLLPVLGALFAAGLIFFILKAIGLYKMARDRDVGPAWLAWVPTIGNYLVGKLIGGRVWGLGGAGLVLAAGPWALSMASMVLAMLTPAIGGVFAFAGSIALAVYTWCALYKLYKIYSPGHAVWWLVASILTGSIGEGIAFFLLRNNTPDGNGAPKPPQGGPSGPGEAQGDWNAYGQADPAPQAPAGGWGSFAPGAGGDGAPKGENPVPEDGAAPTRGPSPAQGAPSSGEDGRDLYGQADSAPQGDWDAYGQDPGPSPEEGEDPWAQFGQDLQGPDSGQGGDDPWAGLM